MRIPGLKYFNMLNIGRLFLEGTEVVATAAQLNTVPGMVGFLTNPTIPVGTPVNAVAANDTLVFAGGVQHGETFEIGADVYEFCTDAAPHLQISNLTHIPVDIEANAVKARGTLSIALQPVAGETITLGTKVYTWVPLGTANADGEVDIGANVGAARLNIVAAINGVDAHNDPHPLVAAAAFIVADSIIEALAGGTVGNAIVSTETMGGAGNAFDAVTLGTTRAGVNCVQNDAAVAAALAIGTGVENVSGVVAPAGTVTVAALVAGIAANGMVLNAAGVANGAFTAGILGGGINGTVGLSGEVMRDASWLYVCIGVNTITGANWRRVAIGAF